MKNILLILIVSCLFSCKKEEQTHKAIVNINVINSAIDLGAIKVNPFGKPLNYAGVTDVVNYGANKIYYSETGIGYLEAVLSTDPTKVVFKKALDLDAGFYSMFLAGQFPSIDTLFKKELDLPFIKTDGVIPPKTDSVVNVRFVNLSPNSPPLKINIRANSINELDDLSYKNVGNWKAYPNRTTATTNQIFEIRNASTNVILLTYTFGATTANRFKNVSLIIKGLVGTTSGTNAFGVFPVNYF